METVTVLILSSKEPELPYQPFYAPYGMSDEEFRHEQHLAANAKELSSYVYHEELSKWQSAESSLREWEIKNYCECLQPNPYKHCNVPCGKQWHIGSTHQARILDNGKVKIIE